MSIEKTESDSASPGGDETVGIDALEHELFISYTHVDNMPRGANTKEEGWIDEFEGQLSEMLWRYRGLKPKIWRDKKLSGNDELGPEIFDAIEKVAMFVSVISPRYIRSDWCPQEIDKFVEATRRQRLPQLNQQRILKVMKLPVEADDIPSPVRGQLGYEFYEQEGDGIFDFNEIDPARDQDSRIKFINLLQDLALDVCKTLTGLSVVSKGKIYVSRPTEDLDTQYISIKRELKDKGWEVVPDTVLPADPAGREAEIESLLSECEASIHLVGKYGPEHTEDGQANAFRGLCPHQEYEAAVERCRKGNFSTLVWIPEDLKGESDSQKAFIEQIVNSGDLPRAVDLINVGFEELKDVVRDRLRRLEKQQEAAEKAKKEGSCNAEVTRCVYLVYQQCDSDSPHLSGMIDHFTDEGLEVFEPVFGEEDPAEIRLNHEANLAEADAVVVFSGKSKPSWLQAQKREIMKSGRTAGAAPPLVTYYFCSPMDPAKEKFRTVRDTVIREDGEDFRPESLETFIDEIKARD